MMINELKLMGIEDGTIEAVGKTKSGEEWSVMLKTNNDCQEFWGILFLELGELKQEVKALRRRLRSLEKGRNEKLN